MRATGERGISRLYKQRVRDSLKLRRGTDVAGIDLTGKIALVKYGGNFRGLKIKGELVWNFANIQADGSAAQEAGAVGCLIFTDPGDDGEITEAHGYAQYPEGPARQVCTTSLTCRCVLTV